MRNKMLVSLIVGCLLSIGTLYLAFRNVPLAELFAYLHIIDYFWLIPTVGLVLVTFLLRVVRWQLILKSAHKIGFWQAFHPLMIGFMMNCVLPGRVGEIARPTILRQKQGVSITTGLSTVAAERLFDIIFLMVLFIFVFGTISKQPDLEVAFGGIRLNNQTLQAVAWAMMRLVIVVLFGVALILMPWSRRWMVQMIHQIARAAGRLGPHIQPRSERIASFLITLLENVTAGLSLMHYPRRLLACFGLTALIWGVSLFSYYVFSLGCPGMDLSLTQLTTVMVVICFFIALPSVPGFWGLWEAGGVFAFALFGFAAKDAAGFTLVNHAVQVFPVILVGWISALATSINIWQISARDKQKPIGETLPAKS